MTCFSTIGNNLLIIVIINVLLMLTSTPVIGENVDQQDPIFGTFDSLVLWASKEEQIFKFAKLRLEGLKSELTTLEQ
jgi:hypothetical protein